MDGTKCHSFLTFLKITLYCGIAHTCTYLYAEDPGARLARSCHRPPRLTVQDHPGRSREVLPVPPPTVYTQFAVNCAVSCTSEKPKDDWPTGWLNICALSPSICPDYQSPHISTCRTTPPHTLKHVCSSPGSIPTKFARSRKRDLSTALAVSTPTE